MAAGELIQRVVTALVLAPLVLAALLALPTPWFALFLLLFIALAAWEWAALSQLSGGARVLFLTLVAVAAASLWWVEWIRLPVLGLVMLWWLVVMGLVVAHPRGAWLMENRSLGAAVGAITLAGAWIALTQVHGDRRLLVLWLLLQVWAADIGAYFAGRSFGTHKLAPRVSPGKSWEGLAGGLVLALAVAAIWAVFDPALVTRWQGLAGVGVISCLIVLVSVLGDLGESLKKRIAGVKDSGRLFPGHGGVLDRIDSLLAAAPAFAIVLWLLD